MDIFDGMIFQNKKGHSWKVVGCSYLTKIEIESLEWHPYTTTVRKDQIVKGTVMYPYGKNSLGEYVGEGIWKASTQNHFYRKWKAMILRCKNTQWQEQHPSYLGVDVCDEWMCLQRFCDWVDAQEYAEVEGISWELDKDLLGNGKLYSPETCCLLPKEVNLFLARINEDFTPRRTESGSWAVYCSDGVNKDNRYVGAYPSYEQAYDIWKAKKNERLFALVDKYNFLPEHILDALNALKK